MRNLIKTLLATVAVSAASWVGAADAAVPATFTQQGRLFNAEGQPESGELNFVFTIYDAAEEGNEVWTDTQTITLDDGYFSTQLEIDPADFTGADLYLGVKVGNDDEMTPRQKLSSVPYAIKAGTADNATGDITPTSVTVNDVEVIDADGKLHGIPGLLTTVTDEPDAILAGADCPDGTTVIGGACRTDGEILAAGVDSNLNKYGCQATTGNIVTDVSALCIAN